MADHVIQVPKSTEKKRNYCAVCSNFRGKIVDGRAVMLHKFPSEANLRKRWLQRLKLVMKTFKMTANSRICSAHFVNGRMTPDNNIPSVFIVNSKKKLFASSVSNFMLAYCILLTRTFRLHRPFLQYGCSAQSDKSDCSIWLQLVSSAWYYLSNIPFLKCYSFKCK